MTINKKISLTFISLALLPLMAYGYFSYRQSTEIILNYAVEEAKLQAEIIALALTVPPPDIQPMPIFYESSKLQKIVEEFHNKRGKDVVIINSEKTILADSISKNIGKKYPHFDHERKKIEEIISRTIREGEAGHFQERSDDGVFEQIVVPIISEAAENETIGAVILDYSIEAGEYRQHLMKEAVNIAKTIGLWIANTWAGTSGSFSHESQIELQRLIIKLHEIDNRDIVLVDANKKIIADVIPQNIASLFSHDKNDEVGQTLKDGQTRTFVEQSIDYPKGVHQVVVPLITADDHRIIGAVIHEYDYLFKNFREHVANEAINVADVLALAISTVPPTVQPKPLYQNKNSLQGFVQNFHSLHGRDFVVLDRDMVILADVIPENIGFQYPHFEQDQERIKEILQETITEGTVGKFKEISDDGVFELVSVPLITADGHRDGVVILEYSNLYAASLVIAQRLKGVLIFVVVVLCIIVVTLALFFSKRISRPIQALSRIAKLVGEGDFSHKAIPLSHDEIGDLSVSFNKMTENLKHNLENKADINEQLRRQISERKQAEAELAKSEVMFRTLFDSANDAVFVLDMEGNFININKIAHERLGYTKSEMLSLHISQLDPPEFAAKISERLEMMAKNDQVIFESAHERKDGTVMPVEINCRTINLAGQKVLLSVIRDITVQKKKELETIKNRKLESLGMLAGGIAHDFNNILAAILGNINLALFDENLPDKIKKLLSSAEKASLRAKDLIQQLLTFSKGGEPVKETSSLERVIKDSAKFVLHGDTVVCRYDIPEDLWFVDIDKGQMSQVIQNIVLNASHAMPEGGIIKITCENLASFDRDTFPFVKDGRFAKISIQDNGIGMSANLVEKIFDPYFSTKHEGSGLGLAIAQSIINKHNGHVMVESAPGAGSTFTIYLPVSEKTQTQKQQEISVANMAFSQAKILIMDDDEMVRTMAKNMLVELGHEVVLAADGEEAVKLYQESITSGKPFDLAILDLTIPGGMGGEKAVQEVLNIDPDAKVVVSSGYSNNPIIANCKDYGFCSAIIKPYKLQELSRVISLLID